SPLQQRHKSLIDDVLGKIRLSFIIIENDNVVDALVQYIKNDAIDLIVVANTKHTSLDKFVLPSVINGISAQVNIPMLVLQNIRK
nr:universal stress protein [Flavobacteriaceae bacterium]